MYEDRSPSGKPCRQLTEGFRSGWILGEKLTGSSGEPTKKGYFPKDYCVSHAEYLASRAVLITGGGNIVLSGKIGEIYTSHIR